MPVAWDCVSVAPARTPDGHVTVPEEVIHSMQKNKIGLKGVSSVPIFTWEKPDTLCRTFGDTSGERCSVSQLDSEKVYISAFLVTYILFSGTQSVQSVCECATMCVTGRLQDRL